MKLILKGMGDSPSVQNRVVRPTFQASHFPLDQPIPNHKFLSLTRIRTTGCFTDAEANKSLAGFGSFA